MSGKKRGVAFEWLLIAVVLIGATLGSTAMIVLKTEPAKVESRAVGPLVEVLTVQLEDAPTQVTGHGEVHAKVRAQVVPQVGGRVMKLHPNMVSGGLIPAGEPLIEIDASDYELAVSSAKADLQRAEAASQSAQAMIADATSRLKDARDDYERMQSLKTRDVATQRELDKTKVTLDVAEAADRTARSQLATAKAQIASARVALEKAQLDLSRTKLTMPFDAVVASEQIDEGQFITAGQSVGEVYGTHMIEIPVPLIDDELRWLPHIPVAGESRSSNPGPLPPATVQARILGRTCQWEGVVARAEGQLDSRTRMIHLVVQVADPFAAGSPPLIPGAFVNVSIQGQMLEQVAELPRHALRGDGDVVWVARDGRLKIQPVSVAHTQGDRVYISEGLEAGDKVVVSSLDVATNGMLVRTPEQAAAPPAAGAVSGAGATTGRETTP
jgi:RND family efflux transporter MFP subunit